MDYDNLEQEDRECLLNVHNLIDKGIGDLEPEWIAQADAFLGSMGTTMREFFDWYDDPANEIKRTLFFEYGVAVKMLAEHIVGDLSTDKAADTAVQAVVNHHYNDEVIAQEEQDYLEAIIDLATNSGTTLEPGSLFKAANYQEFLTGYVRACYPADNKGVELFDEEYHAISAKFMSQEHMPISFSKEDFIVGKQWAEHLHKTYGLCKHCGLYPIDSVEEHELCMSHREIVEAWDTLRLRREIALGFFAVRDSDAEKTHHIDITGYPLYKLIWALYVKGMHSTYEAIKRMERKQAQYLYTKALEVSPDYIKNMIEETGKVPWSIYRVCIGVHTQQVGNQLWLTGLGTYDRLHQLDKSAQYIVQKMMKMEPK